MKKLLITLAALSAAFSLAAQAPGKVSTGDKAFDDSLATLDVRAAAGPDAFYAKLAAQFGVAPADLKALAAADKLGPRELYLALALAKQTGKPLADVAKLVAGSEGKGWGDIAATLGVKPGSDAFARLKDGARKEAEADKEVAGSGVKKPDAAPDAKGNNESAEKSASADKPSTADKPEAGDKPDAPEAPHK